jgi:hypothetical protein
MALRDLSVKWHSSDLLLAIISRFVNIQGDTSSAGTGDLGDTNVIAGP